MKMSPFFAIRLLEKIMCAKERNRLLIVVVQYSHMYLPTLSLSRHYPKQSFTIVTDTPENLRLRHQSELQSQVRWPSIFVYVVKFTSLSGAGLENTS